MKCLYNKKHYTVVLGFVRLSVPVAYEESLQGLHFKGSRYSG